MKRYDCICQKGETFRRLMRLKRNGSVVDLTGWEAKSEVRTEPDGGELVCEMGVSIEVEEGRITLTVTDDVTAGFQTGVYAWDIRITDPEGTAKYYVGGEFRVVPSVTE